MIAEDVRWRGCDAAIKRNISITENTHKGSRGREIMIEIAKARIGRLMHAARDLNGTTSSSGGA